MDRPLNVIGKGTAKKAETFLKGSIIMQLVERQSRHINLALARIGLICLKPLEPTTKRGTPNPKTMRDLFKSKSFLLSNR